MIILGIDPGSRTTGFAIVEAESFKQPATHQSRRKPSSGAPYRHINHGVIAMDVKVTFHERIRQLGQGIRQVIAKYDPDFVVIEKIFMGRNADSAFKLGHARGVVMYEALLNESQVVEYATRSVKKGIGGTGAATKEEVSLALSRLLNIPEIKRLDASDALALAIFHATRMSHLEDLSIASCQGSEICGRMNL